MPKIKRLVQITMFALALVSSALLGMGLESSRLIVIAFIGATIGFFVTDIFKLFRIDGVLANIASIVILFLAMKDFFSEDSTGKLVSVANLLVYLQTVLMFQDKTPRLNWQILVLSLLQVVVGTIFTLDLEAGILFMGYFLVAGTAMVLQSVYADSLELEKRNRKTAIKIARRGNRTTLVSRETAAPLLLSEVHETQRSRMFSMFTQLAIWLTVSAIFTSVMFYLVPRHAKPWYGPANIEVTSTGVSKSVDLDERGIISLSNQLIFRVNFTDVATGQPFDIAGREVYFRGLALSSLVIQDGKTNWIAPHDRVNRNIYQRIPRLPTNATKVYQSIKMEESVDPLLYSVMPFYRTNRTPDEMTFCQEISALTRCQLFDLIDLTPYPYEGGTVVKSDGSFCKAWPYISNSNSTGRRQFSMLHDRPQHEWLTQMEPERYASIVKISDRLAKENLAENGNRLSLLRKMESYFLDPSRFSYTLDFRNIDRDENLDPVEDFVCNHNQGHCELFASALTLMLRRQGIPARLVVGFYGAEPNQLTGGYMVRAKNAHAWVEAYLRPDDCSQELIDNGEAGPGGAWMTLDPTPLSADRMASNMRDNTMDLARTVWDDYVLGMDGQNSSENSAMTLPFFRFLRYLDVDRLENQLKESGKMLRSRTFQLAAGGMFALFMFLAWLRTRSNPTNRKKARKIGMLRRLVADAISLIAPGLGAWVEGRPRNHPTAFYQSMEQVLADADLERESSQTHREFASEVAMHFESHPSAGLIQSTVHEITELFNEVRFGQAELEPELSSQIRMSLDELKLAIASPQEN